MNLQEVKAECDKQRKAYLSFVLGLTLWLAVLAFVSLLAFALCALGQP